MKILNLLLRLLSRVVRCDNRLFKRRSECQQWSRPRSKQTYVSVTSLPTSKTMQVPIFTPISGPTLMEIDSTRRRGPLTKTKKQRRRRANCLCLYCGGLGHIATNCPHRPRRQVYQVSASTKLDLDSPNTSRNPSSPTSSNRFEVLSQPNEVLNE